MQSTNDLVYIKGLVYSSNERVRAVNEAFGYSQPYIIYERVDTRCMEARWRRNQGIFTWSPMEVRGDSLYSWHSDGNRRGGTGIFKDGQRPLANLARKNRAGFVVCLSIRILYRRPYAVNRKFSEDA